ncbi:MAG: hypothetical protein ACRDHO_03090 [Actinomycetota bacterium]
MGIEQRDPVERREFLKRAAIVGTAPVWAAPVIQSLRTPAYAQSPPGHDISFVALLLQCGAERFRTKFNNPSLDQECGRNFAVGNCADELERGSGGIENGCPPGVSASQGPNGSVQVTLGDCCLADFVVKSGQCCAGPGQAGEPPAGQCGGSVTFTRPTSNCEDCISQPPCP